MDLSVVVARQRIAVGGCVGILFVFLSVPTGLTAPPTTTLRQAVPLETQLQEADPLDLVLQSRLRGDAKRGALVYFKSAANCVSCHGDGSTTSLLGPPLAGLGNELTSIDLVDALLRPSKRIRKGYETYTVLTVDGEVFKGMLVEQDEASVTMRLGQTPEKVLTLSRDEIELIKQDEQSMMPTGLMKSIKSQRDFLDLLRYVLSVAGGGEVAEKMLRPSPEQLIVQDDSVNLDHAGILRSLRSRDLDEGRQLFEGDCANCHGTDGQQPALPTARAFSSQELKFGSDPYKMFMTLTKGNGLMGPMTYLTPHQRYQVVHYIRETLMKDLNPGYVPISEEYLESLPKGTEDGKRFEIQQRDFGLALGSQLRRDFPSVLTLPLGDLTVSYNLHAMDLADAWTGGFLDLSETQHQRPRGEGTANPEGTPVAGLAGWQWGHDGSLDYSREGCLPRGPLPPKWMDYHGYYMLDDEILLSYQIDGREVLERAVAINAQTLSHELWIGPGESMVLSVGTGPTEASDWGFDEATGVVSLQNSQSPKHAFTAASVSGQDGDVAWELASKQRLKLTIPGDQSARKLRVIVGVGEGKSKLLAFQEAVGKAKEGPLEDLSLLIQRPMSEPAPQRWPGEITTIGTLGLEQNGYALDTLTRPESTPWNTWFRTTALDFFDDGRMAIATHGGDIWIVSGIDETLTNLNWKRYAAGLYEPFGVKVVDGDVFVTCKDRLVRLHDSDENGEADFYESFSADTDVSTNFHAFNFDLQTDPQGNFYYAKSGHGADFALPGAVWRVSKDGSTRDVLCTGFRTPNGLGTLPDGRITVSDNQGQWTPASKVSIAKPGSFHGWVPTYSIPNKWAPDGGKIDIKKVIAPETFEQPLVWMPQAFDNSSGGQIWVEDERFGPLSNHLLHTSFGKGWMSMMMIQDIGETSQAAIVKLPFDFSTGIMRGRVNPRDGQVYATGLQGWNGGGRFGLEDGGVQRLRYTGIPPKMITDARVVAGGLELDVNFAIDPESVQDENAVSIVQWDYLWSKAYGSDQYIPGTAESDNPKVGTETLKPESVEVDTVPDEPGSSRLRLLLPTLSPVDQLQLQLRIQAKDGEAFKEEVYWTIHVVPSGNSQ
jgi:putative heme-binding domain-containing protein